MLVTDIEMANEVVNALSDECSRRIILSTASRSMTVEEIAKEQQIPKSTCYRKVHSLLAHGMIRVHSTIISDEGKKFICYISCFNTAFVKFVSGELSVDIAVTNTPRKVHEAFTDSVAGSASESISPKVSAIVVSEK